jgi:hypothetical protein
MPLAAATVLEQHAGQPDAGKYGNLLLFQSGDNG